MIYHIFVFAALATLAQANRPPPDWRRKLVKREDYLSVDEDILQVYSDIINEVDGGIRNNLDRYTKPYFWGVKLGNLAKEAKNHPEMIDPIHDQLKMIGGKLKDIYNKKKEGKPDRLTKISDSYANLTNKSDIMLDSMCNAIVNLHLEDISKFISLFNTVDVAKDVERLYLGYFKKPGVKNSKEVINAITFYSYNMAAMDILRGALDKTINGKDQKLQ